MTLGLLTRRCAIGAIALSVSVTAAIARPRTAAPAPLPDVVRVALTTEAGRIVLDLDHKRAPVTTSNFVRYVDQRRLDGVAFYRVMRLSWGTQPNGLIQGGARGDPKRVLKPIAHETTTQTGILHKAGTISMARFAPGTATADFSILVSDMPGLDAGGVGGDPQGYAAFGQVVEGMDVVRRIFDMPLDPVKGEGVLKGQFLSREVKLLTARRVPVQPAASSPTVTK
jgi:peptidyl-prolyl cis-trans isomerase A (cyclophilin A)